MHRWLWTQALTESSTPPWPCPICNKGTVRLVQKSVISHETVASKRADRHEDWHPMDASYVFVAWGECSHTACKERFAISGEGGMEPDYDEDGQEEWSMYFAPRSCFPMPNIIELPSKCPDLVGQSLGVAFSMFWRHRAACASRIRVALEYLMDHLGIPRRQKSTKGKFFDLTLHARIDAYAKTEPVTGAQLMALKWLANTGTHEKDVTQDDLLDALEVLEHSLAEIIDKRSVKVAALAKKLTKKYGG